MLRAKIATQLGYLKIDLCSDQPMAQLTTDLLYQTRTAGSGIHLAPIVVTLGLLNCVGT